MRRLLIRLPGRSRGPRELTRGASSIIIPSDERRAVFWTFQSTGHFSLQRCLKTLSRAAMCPSFHLWYYQGCSFDPEAWLAIRVLDAPNLKTRILKDTKMSLRSQRILHVNRKSVAKSTLYAMRCARTTLWLLSQLLISMNGMYYDYRAK